MFESLVARDDLVIWIGQRKHRKTNLILQFAFSAALAKPFLWFRYLYPRPLKVVFVDYESKSQSLHNRYSRMVEAMRLTEREQAGLRQKLDIFEVRRARKRGLKVPPFSQRQFWVEFCKARPADLYIIDPMRSFHGADENDSRIEALLSGIREVFRATVVISHHMRKAPASEEAHRYSVPITRDVKGWADGARGSGALTAHADVIVGQELRHSEQQGDFLYFGAFLKDGPDVLATALSETAPESFLWKTVGEVPPHLVKVLSALKAAGTRFAARRDITESLVAAGVPRATAFRHTSELLHRGFIVPSSNGGYEVLLSMKPRLSPFSADAPRFKSRIKRSSLAPF